ncbi:MAG: hypothetical protein AB4290_16145 [Spirulina sp.]
MVVWRRVRAAEFDSAVSTLGIAANYLDGGILVFDNKIVQDVRGIPYELSDSIQFLNY